MSSMSTVPSDPDHYPFPESGHRCWQLGGEWYKAMLAIQPQLPHITRRHAQLRLTAEPLWQQLNSINGYTNEREIRASQLKPQYGKIMEEYYALDQELKRFAKLRGLMMALSRHMQRNKLVWPGDEGDYTFPWNTGPARSYSGF